VLDICNTVRGTVLPPLSAKTLARHAPPIDPSFFLTPIRSGIQLRDAYPFLIAPATYTLEQLGIPIPVGTDLAFFSVRA
jgi:hypothetical protein